jgi:hypothetical protein
MEAAARAIEHLDGTVSMQPNSYRRQADRLKERATSLLTGRTDAEQLKAA